MKLRVILVTVLVSALAVVGWFALSPGSLADRLTFISPRQRFWLVEYDNPLNFTAFLGLTFLGLIAAGAWHRGHDRGGRVLGLVVTTMLVLVASFEMAQVWLPRRQADWMDVVCGWLGVLSAAAFYRAVGFLQNHAHRIAARRQRKGHRTDRNARAARMSNSTGS
jgi:hypothetical protein